MAEIPWRLDKPLKRYWSKEACETIRASRLRVVRAKIAAGFVNLGGVWIRKELYESTLKAGKEGGR